MGDEMPKIRALKVHGHGEAEVDLVVGYLTHFKLAYDSILNFVSLMDRMKQAETFIPVQRFRPQWLLFSSGWGDLGRYDWPPQPYQLAATVPLREQLVLAAVRLSSPGWWTFLGSLNPLEVLRQGLNDHHERRKDREYRESAEQRRLLLENLALENKVLSERLRIAKELGATDRDLAPLLNSLVFRPLSALTNYQDRGLIEGAEIVPEVGNEDDVS